MKVAIQITEVRQSVASLVMNARSGCRGHVLVTGLKTNEVPVPKLGRCHRDSIAQQ